MREPAHTPRRGTEGTGGTESAEVRNVEVSVIILTWNSGKTLRRALESVQGASEVILVDGGSTDDTLMIGKEFGARVVSQPQTGPITDFSAVRNAGIESVTKQWVLFLDSDEWMSARAWADVRRVTIETDVPTAYRVARRYILPDGRLVDYASTYPNERLYFFHRDAVEGWTRPVHERVQLKPGVPVRRLTGWSCAPIGTPEGFWRKNEKYLALELRSSARGWGPWMRRLGRAVRSQVTSALRLLWIWFIPRTGVRLPLGHEMVRWKYRWTLVARSFPLR